MSAQRNNPNGLPHPPEIYRRRRIAAIVVIVLVVLLLWWIISSLGSNSSNDATNTAASVSTTTKTVSAEASSTSAESSSAAPSSDVQERSASASESAAPAVAADAKDSCTVDDLKIEARTDKDSYDAGEMPKFYLVAINPTKGNCHIDLATSPMKFEVYDMQTNQRMWSDVDCNTPAATGALDIPSGQSKTYMLTWSRTTSAPNECQNRTAVPAGSYYLHTLLGTNHSDPHTFNLVA